MQTAIQGEESFLPKEQQHHHGAAYGERTSGVPIGWHSLSSPRRRRKGKLFSQVLRTLVQSHTLLQLLAIERVDAKFTN